MKDEWHSSSINTAQCFEHRGLFTIVLDKDVPVAIPRLRGMAHVGNLIRVPQGAVKKSLQPDFLITVAGGESFMLPEGAVREIRDADGEIICVRQEEESVLPPFSSFGERRHLYPHTNPLRLIGVGVYRCDGKKCPRGG
jgi:hypothetical protein